MSGSQSVMRPALVYRFGSYELDTGRNELHKFGLRVKLERKPLQLLTALVERAGEVVTRADLQRLLWGEDVFVDFGKGVNVAAAKLRAALNDPTEEPTYIETVPGVGYRFVAEVQQIFDTTPSSVSAQSNAQVAVMHLQGVPVSSPEQEAQRAPSNGVPSAFRKRKLLQAAVIAVCAVLFGVAITRLIWRRVQQPVHATKIMLVVLPFENLSGDPGQEYFSDGVTEELSAQLGNLNPQRLGVIGRTSAMTYKHSRSTISQIGKDLGVDYVLEGSVRSEENKLRVTAQLVHVPDQAHVWAQDYDRDARDLLQVEDDVAGNIARQVGISISLDQHLLNHHTPGSDAHDDYLLGNYYRNLRTPIGWETAPKYFRRAIQKDPEYAAAYAGLAESLDSSEAQQAKQAALKAVALDPASGEVRAALAWVALYGELDVVAAEDALKIAVHMDPNYAPAHHTYASVLSMTGRLQQGIAEESQATTLDPLSLIMKAALAEALSIAGQQDAAEKELKLVFDMDSRYPKAHEVLGNIYARKGMYSEAIREYKTSASNGGDKLWYKLGFVYGLSGRKRDALSIVSRLEDMERRSGDSSWELAVVEIGLGNREKALAWLERAYREHNQDGLLTLRVDPVFDPLRADRRFQDLLRQMKLAP